MTVKVRYCVLPPCSIDITKACGSEAVVVGVGERVVDGLRNVNRWGKSKNKMMWAGTWVRIGAHLCPKETRRPRSDRGKARHSISSSSSHHQGMSSQQHDDDDDDVKTSRASTSLSYTHISYNSLNPLNYQNYQMSSFSEQTDETLFERQTTLLNQMQQMHKEMRRGFKSFEKELKRVFSKKKK
ncbi:hypothetical protein Tco_1156916 [Tanacetum coccineum]